MTEVIIKNSALCLLCNNEIESTHRWNFVTCSCGNLSVDGGHDYLRRLYRDNPRSWIDTSIVTDEEGRQI